jgi:DNA-binding LacI/PurR family transcriptional regulator
MSGGSPPTLEQVAALAGVSRATVSRVVNGSPKVSPVVRAQVERAVAKLGYVPNRAARSLVTRRTDSVALVVSEPHARFLSEPFFAGMVRGVSAALAETGVQLLLLIAHDVGDRGRLERYVVGGLVDGVLLACLHGDDPLPGTLEGAGVPAVLVGRPAGAGPASYVDADNRGGAGKAVDHLARRGAGGSPPSPAPRTWASARTGWTATGTGWPRPGWPPPTTWSRPATSPRRVGPRPWAGCCSGPVPRSTPCSPPPT